MSKSSNRYNKIDATFFSVVVDAIFTMDASSSESPQKPPLAMIYDMGSHEGVAIQRSRKPFSRKQLA